ncbi:hypothetical protein PI124_g17073 [Phytophthora idaei]|nr:hypothetical protein PI125_g15060 [Phytophthora idaei]KAG3137589.1 hypothetical protein PI126_g17328 [Phytophthora idaei]KAG3237947.1 hypothetical protein PI124_g17073 [Phytophthora idaei]
MAKKAARAGGAVKGDVEASSDQEQLLVEPPSHEADAETREADLANASPCQEASRVKEERAREGDAQALVGGADLVESPEVVGLVSEYVSSDEAKSLNGSVIEIKRDPASFMTEDGNQDADTDPDAAPSAPEV